MAEKMDLASARRRMKSPNRKNPTTGAKGIESYKEIKTKELIYIMC